MYTDHRIEDERFPYPEKTKRKKEKYSGIHDGAARMRLELFIHDERKNIDTCPKKCRRNFLRLGSGTVEKLLIFNCYTDTVSSLYT